MDGRTNAPAARERITSGRNPALLHLKRLAGKPAARSEAGEFLCDGFKLLYEALACGAVLTGVFAADEAELPPLPAGVRVLRMPAGLLNTVSPAETPQGVVFTCRIPAPRPLAALAPGRYLVLDGVQDPGNVGTILRTADALGADEVFLLPGCADPYAPKTVRATMGAVFRQSFRRAEPAALFGALDAGAVPVFGAAAAGAADVRTLSLQNAAVVIGSEGRGISAAARAKCGGFLRIPMRAGRESLNAAAAAAIVLWEMNRGLT